MCGFLTNLILCRRPLPVAVSFPTFTSPSSIRPLRRSKSLLSNVNGSLPFPSLPENSSCRAVAGSSELSVLLRHAILKVIPMDDIFLHRVRASFGYDVYSVDVRQGIINRPPYTLPIFFSVPDHAANMFTPAMPMCGVCGARHRPSRADFASWSRHDGSYCFRHLIVRTKFLFLSIMRGFLGLR